MTNDHAFGVSTSLNMRADPRLDYANREADRVTLVKPVTRKIKLLSRSLCRVLAPPPPLGLLRHREH